MRLYCTLANREAWECGTLIQPRIDDIQDGSDLRRGQPSAHTIYGVAQTINSANHAYFLAQKELLGLREGSSMVNIFNEELINLHRGQGMDIYWRETVTTPTEQEYLLMISNKTGGLFRLAIRLMQAVSSVSVDLVPLMDLLGLIFQIQDDYLNLTSQPVSARGKPKLNRKLIRTRWPRLKAIVTTWRRANSPIL